MALKLARDPFSDVLSTAAFRAAATAQKIGVFDTLRDGPLTSAELANRLATDERGIRLLLETLEIFGYIARDGDRYANTTMTAEWLLPGDPTNFAGAFAFWETLLFELWGNLEKSVRSGEPPLDFYQWLERNPETLRTFQTMLRTIARGAAPEVAEKVKVPADARRLLDIGGSHGEFSAAFCRAYPSLSATVLDLPGALESARETVAEFGDRITLQPGNFLTDASFGSGYDVVLLMSVVHGHLPDENIELLRKVAAALKPGGQMVILEQLAGGKKKTAVNAGTAFNRVFSLNLFHLQGGQTYSYEEIVRWLREAGFRKPRKVKLSPGDSLVMATR
ncbi:MAG TPA: methyltransferase [Thermoanaerobaculia bacterium]|nr:methyltransferase [Thermoanaerobaculia bacterium]